MVNFGPVPKPVAGKLCIYSFGPGFGECQVVILPDGKCVVVDSCLQGGANIPLACLIHFGISSIDLLVVTHADLDHVGGLATLIQSRSIRRVWRYPGAGTLVDTLPRLLKLFPKDTRLREVSTALDALDELQERNLVYDAGPETRIWPGGGAECEVAALAPTPKDVGRYRRDCERVLVELSNSRKPILGERLRRFLAGTGTLSPGANPLSIAIAIRWKKYRIVLGGDVEHPNDPESGWNGVTAILQEDGRLDLIQNCFLVKVAHHGSKYAVCDAAWRQHSLKQPVAWALLSPFNRGKKPPPHREALKKLRSHASRIAVTARPKVTLPGSGWRKPAGRPASSHGRGEVSCVSVIVAGSGAVSVSFSGAARAFAP